MSNRNRHRRLNQNISASPYAKLQLLIASHPKITVTISLFIFTLLSIPIYYSILFFGDSNIEDDFDESELENFLVTVPESDESSKFKIIEEDDQFLTDYTLLVGVGLKYLSQNAKMRGHIKYSLATIEHLHTVFNKDFEFHAKTYTKTKEILTRKRSTGIKSVDPVQEDEQLVSSFTSLANIYQHLEKQYLKMNQTLQEDLSKTQTMFENSERTRAKLMSIIEKSKFPVDSKNPLEGASGGMSVLIEWVRLRQLGEQTIELLKNIREIKFKMTNLDLDLIDDEDEELLLEVTKNKLIAVQEESKEFFTPNSLRVHSERNHYRTERHTLPDYVGKVTELEEFVNPGMQKMREQTKELSIEWTQYEEHDEL